MKRIGMLDSPCVRRAAVSLRLLDLRLIGLALPATGKSAQIIYERGLRLALVSLAAGWQSTQQMLAEVVPAARHPLQAAMEQQPEFRAAPHGDAACRVLP